MGSHSTSDAVVIEISISTPSSPEPEQQERGRKPRRSSAPYIRLTAAPAQLPSDESATFRGRARYRSPSRLDPARDRSRRVRGRGSVSPSRRKLLRVVRLAERPRGPSASRLSSLAAAAGPSPCSSSSSSSTSYLQALSTRTGPRSKSRGRSADDGHQSGGGGNPDVRPDRRDSLHPGWHQILMESDSHDTEDDQDD